MRLCGCRDQNVPAGSSSNELANSACYRSLDSLRERVEVLGVQIVEFGEFSGSGHGHYRFAILESTFALV